jgi:hypothetical protein
VLAAVSSGLVAAAADGTALPMVGCMALFSLVALLINRCVVKRTVPA